MPSRLSTETQLRYNKSLTSIRTYPRYLSSTAKRIKYKMQNRFRCPKISMSQKKHLINEKFTHTAITQ